MSIKISLITICFNSDKTIYHTLNSVNIQKYLNLEYIIVDGKSTDQTLNLVNSYGSLITRIISEPDHGIYDAMNKGIDAATGDVIGFINSDDFYPSSDILNEVADIFSDPSINCCYGDVCYVSRFDIFRIRRYWISSVFSKGLFSKGWSPPHPTYFVRKSVYDKFGKFNLNYKIAADVELMCRFLEIYNISSYYLPKVLVHMTLGGKTNNSIVNIFKQNIEVISAFKDLGINYSIIIFFFCKLTSRLIQFLKKPISSIYY
jgi:glycosyltransferase involved in cell wall biosynthesis